MDGIYVCDCCGRMYEEPTIVDYMRSSKALGCKIEDKKAVCPFCYLESGHDYARYIDYSSIAEDLIGIKYHDYLESVNKLERKDY